MFSRIRIPTPDGGVGLSLPEINNSVEYSPLGEAPAFGVLSGIRDSMMDAVHEGGYEAS